MTGPGTAVLLGRPEVGSPEWHDLRRPMINGSEIAAVLGISPYESPFSLWHRKAGHLGDVPETPEMFWGKKLEHVIVDEFNRRNARSFHPAGQLAHRERRWQGGAPDGLDDGQIIEAKTDRYGERWGEEGTDEIPVHYRAQCLWYLDVVGFQVCHVAVLIAGSDYREYRIKYDSDEAAFMRAEALKFLDSLTGPPPPIDGHDATYQAVRELHPEIDGGVVDLDPNVALPYLTALAACKDADAEKRRCAGEVITAMGSAQYAHWSGERIASRIAPRIDGAPPYLRAVNGAADLHRGEATT